MFQPITSKQNATNNKNSKNLNCQLKTTLLLMTRIRMVESTWAEDTEYSFTDNRKIARSLEKLKSKIINSVQSTLTKLAWMITFVLDIHSSIYIYIYIYKERERECVMFWPVDPAKNAIQGNAPEGGDTFWWQLWEEIAWAEIGWWNGTR